MKALQLITLTICLLAASTVLSFEISLEAVPCSATAASTCKTETPSGGGGWTAAGKKCKSAGANCGTLKVCATSVSYDHANKVATYSCDCESAVSPTLHRYTSINSDLFTYAIPERLHNDLARAAGLGELEGANASLNINDHLGQSVYQGETALAAGSADWSVNNLSNGEYTFEIEIGTFSDSHTAYLSGESVGTLP